MQIKNYTITKYTCFYTYLAMSSIFSLPPLLFVTFHESYGISYTLLGTLVLINFCTQLGVDLIFTFFGKFFNVKKVVKYMPLITSLGLLIYAGASLLPKGFVYAGLATGTVIFSVSAGLSEVLLSPTVAAIPSKTPEKDMSMLHSLYAYGVVTVVLVSTLFFAIFGRDKWMYITLFWAVLPVVSFILFSIAPMPEFDVSNDTKSVDKGKKNFVLMLFMACIFLGSAAENVMTNWISGYMETALGLKKAVGDVLGMAIFAILLGIGRTWYAKRGKNIMRVLFLGMLGSAVCYLVSAMCENATICLAACVLTGFCTSMLWPGTLILMEERIPNAGVAAYALMAAGGDFGGSVAPQLMGIVVDTVSASAWANAIADGSQILPEQIGMKVGMMAAAVFPIIGVLLLTYMKKYFNKNNL